MNPIDFPQSTKVLQKPGTMLDSECQSLPIWNDGKECISCWRASFKERVRILLTGKVWLSVLSGRTQPPVFVTGKYIFVRPPFFARVRLWLEDAWDNIKMASFALKAATQDKDIRNNFICGFIISLLVGIFSPLLGLCAGCVTGAIKKWWTSKGHGIVKTMEFAFTCFGALVALILSLFIHAIVW